MKYDITKKSAPAMPNLGKGTECIKLLLSQTSKDMHEPLVPMLFPVLGAHISGAEFQYPDRNWKETCGMMANLVAETGGNKGQLSTLVEAICRDFREHVPQVSELAQGCTGRDGCFAPCPDAAAQGSKVRGRGLLYRAAGKIPMIFRKPPAMSTKDRQRPLRMQYLCTIKKTTAYKGPDNGVETPKQRRCFTGRSLHSRRWGRNT